jgi:hypothetical protein
MRFARIVFTVAGIYGIIVLLPNYFLLERIGRDTPPPVTHVEYFYGFVGTALVWQLVFLLIGRDPARFRPLMAIAVLEKLAFGVPVVMLFAQGRLAASVLVFGVIDLVLGASFLVAWARTPRSRPDGGSRGTP